MEYEAESHGPNRHYWKWRRSLKDRLKLKRSGGGFEPPTCVFRQQEAQRLLLNPPEGLRRNAIQTREKGRQIPVDSGEFPERHRPL